MRVGVIFAGIVYIRNVSETDRMHEVTTAALRRGGCALYATKESRTTNPGASPAILQFSAALEPS